MSAYVVNKRHIDYLLTFALKGRGPGLGLIRVYHDEDAITISGGEVDRAGQILWGENVKSVNYRYNEHDDPQAYWFSPYLGPVQLSPVNVIHACQCLEYQSCEHPGWADSFAKRILDAIFYQAIRELPGYDNAPWHIS